MNAYLLIPLIQVLFCLVLIPIVLKGHFRNVTHRLFSLYLLSLAIWGIIIFFMRSSPDVEHAYSVEKWLLPLGPFMAVFSYHFSVRYTATKVKSWLLPSAYLICLIFAPLVTTDLIISGMQLKPYGYAPVFGSVAPFYILFVTVLSVMALLNFIRMWKTSAYAEQRNRAAYIAIGNLFSLVGGAFDVLPVLGLPLYPGVIIGNTIFCLLTTVAIVKHNLLDIRVVIRKGTAYVLTSAVAAVPFIVIFLLATRVFTEIDFPLWAYFIVAIVLAFALPHLWQWVQQWVNRWFYRDRYDYLKALETFSQQTQSVTGFAGLGSTMVNLLAKALRSSNVYLLQPLPPDSDFTTVSTNDKNKPAPAIHLKKESAIVKWLERSNNMLSYRDIEIIPQLQGTTSKEKQVLKQVEAELISPLKAPTGKLSGILVLGKKLSEQPYNSEDKQLIYTICNHMSTNLENARLYHESQHEVEERKQAEELFKTLTNSLIIGVYIVQDGKFVFVNPQFQKDSGFAEDELMGVAALSTVHPDDRQLVRKEAIKRLKSGSSSPYEFRTVTKNGETRVVVETVASIQYKGKRASLGSHMEITELKQAEERETELQRELYLSSRLASIGELAAGVAHQLNNPLTGILGFSQRILRKVTDQETSQDLRKIYGEAERASKIVQNLLTFARRRQPKKEYSDVNNVVQSTLELRAYELKTSNIEVKTKLASSLPKIMFDFYQIQEVFLNLILNAEQAMTDANGGGKLIIKTEKNTGYVRCIFSDDGPGIPLKNLDTVFDPFFTTKGERGGTGLGLSVCHGIITEHGGKIYVQSKPGKGTTFFVELPIIIKEYR